MVGKFDDKLPHELMNIILIIYNIRKYWLFRTVINYELTIIYI